jgi:hypothetical protein
VKPAAAKAEKESASLKEKRALSPPTVVIASSVESLTMGLNVRRLLPEPFETRPETMLA